ncbi:hypothetical protein H257_08136 [Aphanomyces astaci]|uniref:Uncharacterized protein n=1 Tax=Aphanomyces astaci TaxID=112090 RepID=W4GG57_APHAT|nr:hypothetical protein H257_08136 [Aphanomyces astaci]ETV78645.1 hypothetical protein H257_08136 [Aphanomyces astaci]|eukprot:XP_009832226.1 hypothetical protein H257_08136 [Aphanomyces astaci]
MGNTLSWLSNQAAYPTDRRTILPTGLETPRTCGWTRGLTRFYWRTIAMTLHTNAAKHRLDGRWGPHCRLCYENPRDTVGHRWDLGTDMLGIRTYTHHGWLKKWQLRSIYHWPRHGTKMNGNGPPTLPFAGSSTCQLLSQVRWENMQLPAGQYGYITPRWLGRTALSVQPLLAPREI